MKKNSSNKRVDVDNELISLKKLNPEERLLLSVLNSAIMDYVKLKSLIKERLNQNQIDDYNNLRLWFYHDYDELHVFSFKLICDYFDLDKDDLKKKVDKLTLEKMNENLVALMIKNREEDDKDGEESKIEESGEW